MAAYCHTPSDLGRFSKTHVSLRIELPSTTYVNTVHVVGSWDDFRNAIPLEQDRRVGREIWKGIITQNGGLEMGFEYRYYFLLDQQHVVPNPQSSPGSLTVDEMSGKLHSLLFVPIELPTDDPSSQVKEEIEEKETGTPLGVGLPCDGATQSVFEDFDDDDEAPENYLSREPSNLRTSLRKKFQMRKSMASLLGNNSEPEQKPKRRMGWGLSVSTAFLKTRKSSNNRSVVVMQDDGAKEEQIKDIAGYLRRDSIQPSPFSQYTVSVEDDMARSSSAQSQEPNSWFDSHSPSTLDTSPGMQSSFYSSGEDDGEEEDEEEDFEIETPIDSPGLGICSPQLEVQKQQEQQQQHQQTERWVYPRYYNFDEIIAGSSGELAGEYGKIGDVRPLGCLKEEIDGQLKWRDEMVDELGYLSGVV